jgi:hypothetical protein
MCSRRISVVLRFHATCFPSSGERGLPARTSRQLAAKPIKSTLAGSQLMQASCLRSPEKFESAADHLLIACSWFHWDFNIVRFRKIYRAGITSIGMTKNTHARVTR